MGFKALGAILIAAAVGFAAWPTDPADAATKKRTRVVVTKRSYLDAGTEVKPGERHFTDYVFYPGYNPWKSYNIDPMNSFLSPPDPFWLPGSR